MAKQASVIFSHWYHLFETLQESPKTFYESLESSIKKRGVEDVSLSRIDYHEGGVFSAKREYLRAERHRLVFDVCAAPFGNGFFVSWWLGETRSFWNMVVTVAMIVLGLFLFGYFIKSLGFFSGIVVALFVSFLILWVFGYLVREGSLRIELSLSEIPLFGPMFDLIFKPLTYYRIDTNLMFQQSIHMAVLEVVDEMTKAKGVRSLSETERKPILKNLLKK